MSINVTYEVLDFILDPKAYATLFNALPRDEVWVYDADTDQTVKGTLTKITKTLKPGTTLIFEKATATKGTPPKNFKNKTDRKKNDYRGEISVSLPGSDPFQPDPDQAEILMRTAVGEKINYQDKEYIVDFRSVGTSVKNKVEFDNFWTIQLK